MSKLFTRLSAAFLAVAALAFALAAPSTLRAEGDQAQSNDATLSDAVGDGLSKLKPFIDAKDTAGAVKLIETLMATAAADSFDQAYLLETKAKVLTMGNDYAGALEPLEQSLAISDRHHYYTKQQTLDMLYFLSQLYYQQAEGAKTDKDAQLADYQKSISTIERWLTLSPKQSADMTEYYSRLLYSEASAKDPQHPDLALIKQAKAQIEKTLLLTARPKENTYVFLLATLQQEQDYAGGAQLLEFLLSKNPKNKTYWQDLVTFYIVLAQNEKDLKKVRMYNIRAVNTLERAQELGYLQTPKDNYLLFTFYYELGQYGTAADILHKGLMNGTIDSDLDKWELLASSYQQINQDFTAIEVLKEAASRFPTKGDLDLKIGGIYAGMDKGADALKYYKSASEKGGLGKSQLSYLLLAMAYQAYELQEFDDAKAAVDKAVEHAGGKPDHQLNVLKNAIDDAIKSRDERKKADELK